MNSKGISQANLIAALFSVMVCCAEAVLGEEPKLNFWQQTLESYQHGDYGAAAAQAQRLMAADRSEHESAARLIQARSYLHMGRLPEALKGARELRCLYPSGRYAPYADYLMAQIEFQQLDFFEAALCALDAAQATRDDDLNLLARAKLERLFEIYLNPDQRQRLLTFVEAPLIRAELTAIQEGYRLPLKVGVILDLSEPQFREGQAFLEGIEAACQEARKRARLETEIVSRDSQGDVFAALRAAQMLIGEENVVALIGDLDPNCAAVIAAAAEEHHVPLVIPACQDVGLTTLGRDVYQLAPDFQIEGAAVAEYALSIMRAQRIAILAPASADGKQRVTGFKSFLEEHGGRIAAQQWYFQDTADFRRLLESLASLKTEPPPSEQRAAADSAAAVPDSLAESSGQGLSFPDSTAANLPINYFDALYIPFQGEEFTLLLAQLAALGYHGNLIGSSNCLDLVKLDANRRYAEGMVFPSLWPSPQGWDDEADFGKSFSGRTGIYPRREHVLGWDAFNFLGQVMKDPGKLSPVKISNRLREVHRFQSVHVVMSFNPDERINRALYWLKVENGRLVQIADKK